MSVHVRLSSDGRRLEGNLDAVLATIRTARAAFALTGAGVSVESGVPDFRSATGLWTRFDPFEYATLSTFLASPEKSWAMFRELAQSLDGIAPNPAHAALAELERSGRLVAIVTQNIDGLHQAAGSHRVLEIHGEGTRLHCVRCGHFEPFTARQRQPGPVPACPRCTAALKPNVVLFEEPVRHLETVSALVRRTNLVLVAGTSARVAPASQVPLEIVARGGSILEFNLEVTDLTREGLGPRGALVEGPVGRTLPLIVEALSRGNVA